jgi:CRISPR system Cascade subunit CasA
VPLHALDPIVRRLLVGLRSVGDDFDVADKGLCAWEESAASATWSVAEQVLSAVPPTTFVGRSVTKDGKERLYRLSTAERAFRIRINDILARRAAARRSA